MFLITKIQNLQTQIANKIKIGFSWRSKEDQRSKELKIYEGGYRQSNSGIRATIFGATGFLGPYVGAILGYIGSDLIFPHSHTFGYDDDVKELKLCAVSGQSQLVKCFRFENDELLDRVIKNSNVVINMVGPRRWVKDQSLMETINIDYSRRIAKACARNPNIVRLIQFSAAGAKVDSPSLDLRTKFKAEQEVLNHFPNATILRPTTVYGMNDYFVRHWYTQRDYFHHFNIVTDDCTAKRQPLLCNDLAQCVLNVLKLPETCGQTYELGGPHQYTRLEIYEILHNFIGRPPKLVHVPFNVSSKAAQYIGNWEYFSLEAMIKDQLDLIVSPGAKTIDDLYVRPVSFVQGVEQFIHDMKARFPGSYDLYER